MFFEELECFLLSEQLRTFQSSVLLEDSRQPKRGAELTPGTPTALILYRGAALTQNTEAKTFFNPA